MTHDRPQKITLAEMRAANVRGLQIYCSDYRCSHWTAISGDRWPDDVRLSDLEPRFTCQACGRRGADVRPNWKSVEWRRLFNAIAAPSTYALKRSSWNRIRVTQSARSAGLH